MPYGTVKVDNVTFTNNSVDATTTFSGIYASITNNLTLSGTATATTFTGTTANFTNVNAQNIGVTTSLSGLAITGGTAGFTTITGTTVTGTTANFATVSGTTVTGTTARFITITGGTAGFTTITGTTVTGTTANFVTVSGTTVTGTTASFTSGIFTSLSGTTHTITSGVFASGTAALPSISFVSDPNTGIYSPGADQVAVATSGTGRLLVGSNGRIGIDTSTASAKFVVSKAGAEGIEIEPGDASGVNLTRHYDRSGAAFVTSSVYAANHIFYRSFTEALRITSAGLVGIGTSAPETRLTVAQGGNFSFELKYTGAAADNQRWVIGHAATSMDLTCLTDAGSGGGNFFRFNRSAQQLQSFQGYQSAVAWFHVDNSTARVGIGTTSPNNNLEVRTTGVTSLQVANTGQSSFTITEESSGESRLACGGNNSFLTIHTGTTTAERARIDSSGRLLVGTSSSSGTYGGSINTLFQVAGGTGNTNAYPGISCSAYSTGDSWATVSITKSNSNTVGTQTAVAANHRLGELTFEGSNGTSHKIGASIYAENDQASAWGTTDCPSRLVFSTTADGASSPTEAMRINNQQELLVGTATRTANGGKLQISNGITFPATAVACTNANTLDDYEEGTWTPTAPIFTGDASAFFQVANYIKIGRNVTVFWTLTSGGTSGSVQIPTSITGLPYAMGSGASFTTGNGTIAWVGGNQPVGGTMQLRGDGDSTTTILTPGTTTITTGAGYEFTLVFNYVSAS